MGEFLVVQHSREGWQPYVGGEFFVECTVGSSEPAISAANRRERIEDLLSDESKWRAIEMDSRNFVRSVAQYPLTEDFLSRQVGVIRDWILEVREPMVRLTQFDRFRYHSEADLIADLEFLTGVVSEAFATLSSPH